MDAANQQDLFRTPERPKHRKNIELTPETAPTYDKPRRYQNTPDSINFFGGLIGKLSSSNLFSRFFSPLFSLDVKGFLHENSTPSKQGLLTGDRFVPNRRETQFSLFSELDFNEDHENQNIDVASQNKGCITISDMLKKHVLGLHNPTHNSPYFKNLNNLKFGQPCSGFYQNDLENNQQLLTKLHMEIEQSSSSPLKKRKISKVPIKVLDAPNLQDDYYLNLVDWSKANMLAVALGESLYMWSATTSKVVKLCELSDSDTVTSTAWCPSPNILAIGTNTGDVQIWDANRQTMVRKLTGHTARVGALAWNNSNFLSSGSRDKTILNRDIRDRTRSAATQLTNHKQEVCGLKWSYDNQHLASGGNDNRVYVWSNYSDNPLHCFNKHAAAVKALAWSPHQYGLLCSGGGTADRTIRFWNTLTGDLVNEYDVGSQVCNLMFSETVNQLVSTHGFSHNQINVWRYPTMEKLRSLTGHTSRVLYLSMSPDSSTIVTGAGDETLRFWNVFPAKDVATKKGDSKLSEGAECLR